MGDMIVTDRHNRSFYVNFDFSNLRTRKVRRLILNGKRMVHYEYIERLPDEASGRTEAYRLEVLKSEDLQRVVSLHLGVYTSRRAKSYWVICEP